MITSDEKMRMVLEHVVDGKSQHEIAKAHHKSLRDVNEAIRSGLKELILNAVRKIDEVTGEIEDIRREIDDVRYRMSQYTEPNSFTRRQAAPASQEQFTRTRETFFDILPQFIEKLYEEALWHVKYRLKDAAVKFYSMYSREDAFYSLTRACEELDDLISFLESERFMQLSDRILRLEVLVASQLYRVRRLSGKSRSRLSTSNLLQTEEI